MRTPQRCQHCKTVTSHIVINSRRKLRDGTERIQWMCNTCTSARIKSYYQQNKRSFRAMLYRSMVKHKEKQKARHALYRAIRLGVIHRPANCEECEKKCKPHGHHEDYSKPLEVNWLCTTCHSERHKEHRAFVDTSMVAYT